MDRKRTFRALGLVAACLVASPAFAAADLVSAGAPAVNGLLTAGILGLYVAGCPRPARAEARP